MQLGQCSTSATLPLSNLFHKHSHLMKYGIILGGNSFNSGEIFTVQKQIIRVMVGAWPKTPRISHFKDWDFIFSVPVYLYIFINELHCK